MKLNKPCGCPPSPPEHNLSCSGEETNILLLINDLEREISDLKASIWNLEEQIRNLKNDTSDY